MAKKTSLVTTFIKSSGDTFSQTLSDVKENATDAQIKNYINTVVTNGQIFTKVPTAVKSAKLRTVEEKEIDLS